MKTRAFPPRVCVFCILVFAGVGTVLHAEEDRAVPVIRPWKVITLDPDYRGAWCVAGDLDGDGEVEIVTAQGNRGEDHYVTAVGVKKLDGSTLWNWGSPNGKNNYIAYDIACQIHDWDNDGDNEVVILTRDGGDYYAVELDGATGAENRRFKIPNGAADCITFCNISGPAHGHPKDIIVKTRYNQIWAYDYDGKRLWDTDRPGGYETAHQVVPMDIDNDGVDELSLGCTMADGNGKILWSTKKNGHAIGSHVDCARLFKSGPTLDDVRIALTYCGGNRVAVTNGHGKILWAVTGRHYESLDMGKVRADIRGRQIIVDVDHQAWGKSPICVFDEAGNKLSEIDTAMSRHHWLVDWFGNGLESIVVAQSRSMYDGHLRKVATFDLPFPEGESAPVGHYDSMICATGDINGDQRADIIFYTNPGTVVFIYRNTLTRPDPEARLGTERNFSFY